jgi:hypothetical protein
MLLLLQVCRLFDLFLATHPLMPLYVGAVAMHSQRSQLLAAEEMPMLHSSLVNLAITKRATADQLAVQVRLLLVCEVLPAVSPAVCLTVLSLKLRLSLAAQPANFYAGGVAMLHSRLVSLAINMHATAGQLAVQVGRLLDSVELALAYAIVVPAPLQTPVFFLSCCSAQAIELFKRAPPQQLIASNSLLLQQCVAPRVRLQGGVWQYPEPRTSGPGLWSQQRLQLLVQQMLRLPLPGECEWWYFDCWPCISMEGCVVCACSGGPSSSKVMQLVEQR